MSEGFFSGDPLLRVEREELV
jgi:hypothetical protein